MSTPHWSRRAALAACGAFARVAGGAGRAALAQSGRPVRAIRVDVAPLRANAGDPTAAGSPRSCRAPSLGRWLAASPREAER